MPEPSGELSRTIADGIGLSLRGARPIADSLDLLLEASGARAAGLWRHAGDRLKLLGFRAVAGISIETGEDFAAATRSVPLTRMGLGIVKAAVTRAPAAAFAEEGEPGGSGTWLRRFEAKQSLAVPVLGGGRVLGVIAVSAPRRFEPGSPAWVLLERIAGDLGPALALAPHDGDRGRGP